LPKILEDLTLLDLKTLEWVWFSSLPVPELLYKLPSFKLLSLMELVVLLKEEDPLALVVELIKEEPN